MAAAPGEDLTPFLLLPPKLKSKDPSYLDTSPAAATACWSSLPADLVRRIADCFLATNDIDCYMYFRAVCLSWRAATDDPRSNASDPRFQPRRWVILDEAFHTQGSELLLLNTGTGRFLRKKLPPLLRECHHVVATTPGGFFVLADRSPPHAARLFNPLTGVTTPFAAPVPPEARVAVGFNNKDGSLAVLLFGDSSRKIYKGVPDSEAFAASQDYPEGVYNLLRSAVVGGAYSHISGPAFVDVVARLFDVLHSLHADPAKAFSTDCPGDAANDGTRCFLVGLDEHMVLVMKTFGSLFLFRVDTEICRIEPLQSIGRFAIFVGHRRCLSVDTSKFPGIEANCVYYAEHLENSSARICKYSLRDEKAERITEAAEFVKRDKLFVLVADRPFTAIQLLCSYTINTPDSQLALQQMS